MNHLDLPALTRASRHCPPPRFKSISNRMLLLAALAKLGVGVTAAGGALDHARGLLLMARKDFDAMRGMIGNPLFAYEVFGFHARQAIER